MLHSSTLNAKQFKLEILQPNLDSNQSVDDDHESFEIHISKLNPASNFTQHEMENMNIQMSCQVPGSEKKVVNVGSVASRLLKMKAEVSRNRVIVNVKRPNNICGEIAVKVLGSHLVNSPILHHLFYSEDKEPSDHNLTILDESVSIFDMTLSGLTRIDQMKLEKTRRQVLGGSDCKSTPELPFPLAVGVSSMESAWEQEEENFDISLSDRVSVFKNVL